MASSKSNRLAVFGIMVSCIMLLFGNNLLCRKENSPNIDKSTNLQQDISVDNSTNIYANSADNSSKVNRNTLIRSMERVFDKIHEEISKLGNESNQLSPFLIREIIELSHSLEPYKYLSKERGSLVKRLSLTGLDEKSLENIYNKGDFKYSDLIYADLDGAYLNGIDLSYSNFYGATFKLSAQIEKSTFINCVLDSVSFEDASLDGAIIESTIYKTIFDGI